MPCQSPLIRLTPAFNANDRLYDPYTSFFGDPSDRLEFKSFDVFGSDGQLLIEDRKAHNNCILLPVPRELTPADYASRFSPLHNPQEIPCGRCSSCRLKSRRDTVYRMVKEAESYNPEDVLFLTLTYEDSHLTMRDMVLPACYWPDGVLSDDVVVKSASLVKKDFQDFMKRLRSWLSYNAPDLSSGVRFYCCGEYGEKTHRPHYHVILFGLSDSLLRLKGSVYRWSMARRLYRSSIFDEIWGKGNVLYGIANFATMQYVAGYVLKKAIGRQSDDENLLFYLATDTEPEIEPYRDGNRIRRSDSMIEAPFNHGSRRPGLARAWYEEHKAELWSLDSMYILDGKGKVQTVKPCRYFDRLYDFEDGTSFSILKQKRRFSAIEKNKVLEAQYSRLNVTPLQLRQKMIDAENAHFARIKREEV